MSIPKEMKALVYDEPRKFSVKTVPVPEVGDDDLLLKGEYGMEGRVSCCAGLVRIRIVLCRMEGASGWCSTDARGCSTEQGSYPDCSSAVTRPESSLDCHPAQ